jgi:hypothetical protein
VRRQRLDPRHQGGQQPGADGVDHAEAHGPCQRILAGGGDLGHPRGFGQGPFGLRHDLGADRRRPDIARAALEQGHAEFFFELFHRHRQGRLRHIALVRGAAEMALAGEGNDVAELGQGHVEDRKGRSVRPTPGAPSANVVKRRETITAAASASWKTPDPAWKMRLALVAPVVIP